jgi:gamma-glutamyltranspeptidase / glutathione hydrolase
MMIRRSMPVRAGARARWWVLALGVGLLAGGAAVAAAGERLGVPGRAGAVLSTTEPAAAQAGLEIIHAGGNAVDAAAAMILALAVVEPQSAGIGGGGFMMIHRADRGETVVIDSRETAPAAADPAMLEGLGFALASTSGVSVGVPGALRGIELALARHGRLRLDEVLQPAIRLAEDGFRVSPRLAESLGSVRLGTAPGNPAYDEARRWFRPEGRVPEAGELLRLPDLARSLRLIAEAGADAFYHGAIAEAIVATQRAHRQPDEDRALDAARLVGRMTQADLAAYRAVERAPLWGEYRGVRIAAMPSPSSGGLTALQVLGLLEGFPIGDRALGQGLGEAATLHLLIEALRLAFADRALWMGDADRLRLPGERLLHPDYLSLRRVLLRVDRRLEAALPGDPWAWPRHGVPERVLAAGPWPEPGSVNTTHVSVVDADGNMVSYTNTIEAPWGSGLMVPGWGFLLNNQLTDFNASPRRSAAGEAYDPGANDVAPGKRPRSSMAPTMLFIGDQPVAAFGSPGGASIISTVIQVTMNLIDAGLDAQAAVDAPRIAQVSPDGALRWEPTLPKDLRQALRALGHPLHERPMPIGAAQLVLIDPLSGLRYGAADRRRGGAVLSSDHQPP